METKLKDNSRVAINEIKAVFEKWDIKYAAQQVFLLDYMKYNILSGVK